MSHACANQAIIVSPDVRVESFDVLREEFCNMKEEGLEFDRRDQVRNGRVEGGHVRHLHLRQC